MATPDPPIHPRSVREMRDILAQAYPVTYRLSRALVGREEQARRVVRFVMHRSLRVLPKWRGGDKGGESEDEAGRWFYHHTILAARRVKARPFDARHDALIDPANTTSPEYVAFIRAIRSLPHQQKEVFLLHFAEKCDPRGRAVAMDCSTTAAATHLSAAEAAIRTIARERFDSLIAEMARVYTSLAPTERLVVPRMTWIVRRYVWPRRIARIVAWLLTLGLVAALAWSAWWLYQRLEI